MVTSRGEEWFGTDVWKFSEAVRSGKMSMTNFLQAESGMSRSRGTCMTMGTASTMASLMEGLGLALPHNAALPAVDARRQTLAHMTGRRIVEMVKEDITPSKLLDKRSFENAIMLNAAIGGSTNAIVHLLAIAGRLGIDLKLEDFQRCGRDVPLLVNPMPSGQLDEDFCYAERPRYSKKSIILHTDAKPFGLPAPTAECFNRDVIKTVETPVQESAGITVLKAISP